MLKERAHAKLNLHLQITGVREDGYHTLSTVFVRVSLYDLVMVEFLREPVVEVRILGDYKVPQGPDNVVYKAVKWYLARYGIKGWGAKVLVEKRIPPGSGLGGGSADAGATIRALVRFFKEYDDGLVADSARIGADVPFFVADVPVAYAEGVGEVLEPVDVDFSSVGFYLSIPPVAVSTARAFSLFDGMREEVLSEYPLLSREEIVEVLKSGDPAVWAGRFFNHLEIPVFKEHEAVKKEKERLLNMGFPFVLMSGSGSAVYGALRGKLDADGGLIKLEVV